MSTSSQLIGGIGTLFKGLLIGVLTVVLFVVGLIAIIAMFSASVSAESPDIEYHTDLALDSPTYILRDLDSAIIELEVALEMLDWVDCEGAYRALQYRVKYIQAQIKRLPKTSQPTAIIIYKDAIRALKEGITELDNSEACGK